MSPHLAALRATLKTMLNVRCFECRDETPCCGAVIAGFDPDPTLARWKCCDAEGHAAMLSFGTADRRVSSPANSELFQDWAKDLPAAPPVADRGGLDGGAPEGEFADANDRSWPLRIMTHLVTLPEC